MKNVSVFCHTFCFVLLFAMKSFYSLRTFFTAYSAYRRVNVWVVAGCWHLGAVQQVSKHIAVLSSKNNKSFHRAGQLVVIREFAILQVEGDSYPIYLYCVPSRHLEYECCTKEFIVPQSLVSVSCCYHFDIFLEII